ncbi:MAG TPA: PDZ domain-containing protein [Planctomycetota bacterium]
MKATLAIAALLAAAGTAAAQQDDERVKRILDRVEKEIRDSEARLRDDIRAVLRAELRKEPAAKPEPGPSAEPPAPRRRVLLGVTADEFTDAERKALGVGGGIKVGDVRGPAATAGVKAGDILLELDGKPVTEETVGAALESKKPGDEIEATLLRGGKREKVRIRLAERKE